MSSTTTLVAAEPAGELPDGLIERSRLLSHVWRRAAARAAVYTLVDADPLDPVVAAWRRRLLGEGDDVELAIGLSGDAPIPDYYLVDVAVADPEIHWYLGYLREQAPSRLLGIELDVDGVLAALADLPFGAGFPSAAELAAGARTFVPTPGLATSDGAGTGTNSRLVRP